MTVLCIRLDVPFISPPSFPLRFPGISLHLPFILKKLPGQGHSFPLRFPFISPASRFLSLQVSVVVAFFATEGWKHAIVATWLCWQSTRTCSCSWGAICAYSVLASLWWCIRSLPRLRHVHCVHVALNTLLSGIIRAQWFNYVPRVLALLHAPGSIIWLDYEPSVRAGTMQIPPCRLWSFLVCSRSCGAATAQAEQWILRAMSYCSTLRKRPAGVRFWFCYVTLGVTDSQALGRTCGRGYGIFWRKHVAGVDLIVG